jgi:hypothetical protein
VKGRTLGLAVAGVAIVGLIAGVVLLVMNRSGAGRGTSSGSADVTWNVPDGTVSTTDTQSLRDALQSSPGVSALVQPDRTLTITQASLSGNYSVLYADIHQRFAPGADTGADPVLLVGVRSGSSWNIVAESEPDFCAAMRSSPDAILPPSAKSFFIGC